MEAKRAESNCTTEQFNNVLEKAIADDRYLFANVPKAAVPELVDQIVAFLDIKFPGSSCCLREKQENNSIDRLVLLCDSLVKQGHVRPDCCYTFLTELNDQEKALISFLGEQNFSVRQLFCSETLEDLQRAEIVDFCAKSISLKPDQSDIALVTALLKTQEKCVVNESTRNDPSKPVRGGLLSPITPEEFLLALNAENAQILICKNADKPYGFTIYHGKGSCAEEDREFVNRAIMTLQNEVNQMQAVATFGVRFNPESVATAYTALIDPDIRLDFEIGGAETSRTTAYDSMVYYLLRELAKKENRPEWVLAWVRSWPYPNDAVKAHERVLFHNTDIELDFNPKDPNPDRLRLKLLLVHLDSHFDAQGKPRMDINSEQNSDPLSYRNLSHLHLRRMLNSSRIVPLIDLDSTH